jgi:hypothetical protein
LLDRLSTTGPYIIISGETDQHPWQIFVCAAHGIWGENDCICRRKESATNLTVASWRAALTPPVDDEAKLTGPYTRCEQGSVKNRTRSVSKQNKQKTQVTRFDAKVDGDDAKQEGLLGGNKELDRTTEP